jgi:uncharacterized protein YbbC (DUF1343 family)
VNRRRSIRCGIVLLLLFGRPIIAASGFGSKIEKEAPLTQETAVIPGVEVFLQEHLAAFEGKRIGLLTHAAAVDRGLETSVELLGRNPRIRLVALYGPEHGVRGNFQAGEYVPFYFDEKLHLPVFSLYGQSMKPAVGMMKNIDEYMRSFDTDHGGKRPGVEMIRDVDLIVCDLQDVGTRVYTYVATMAYTMQACAENGIGFVVLDRPNPIGGLVMEGPVLEYPRFSSPVGLYPVPLRHGMTMGELALLFNARFLERKANVTVIPMKNWRRRQWFDQTSLPWVPPSPNMPTLDTATVYPGQVFFEGTNLSEGRGTTRPFEVIGAPWIDGFDLARKMNQINLPGVRFRETWFTPAFSKFQGERCGGIQLHVVDRSLLRPFSVMLHLLRVIMDEYPKRFAFHPSYFDQIMGTARVREALESGAGAERILALLEAGLRRFTELRKPFLLYDE